MYVQSCPHNQQVSHRSLAVPAVVSSALVEQGAGPAVNHHLLLEAPQLCITNLTPLDVPQDLTHA
jgi:hypothetical protein